MSSADSLNHYHRLAAQGDAKAMYIMAGTYYSAINHFDLPAGAPRINSQAQSDSLIYQSAIKGYLPAIQTIRCAQSAGCWSSKYSLDK